MVEFEEGRRMARLPAEAGQGPPGHLWRWELESAGSSRTRVTCTYDWTRLADEKCLVRARATTVASSAPRSTDSRPWLKDPDRPAAQMAVAA